MTGKQILNYRIEELIGKGGMGSVYLASNINIDHKVAIKILAPHLANNDEIKRRFEREAKTLATLDHQNIVKFINYYESQDGVFLIMEYVKGMTLEDYINNVSGPIPEEKTLEMFSQILDAFSYAHQQGVVHRDIKPSNIIITPKNKIKILDFGIARIINEAVQGITQAGTKMGTVAYMSPEQVRGKEVDSKSDIYSLGVVLHQMVTGKIPYDHTTMSEYDINVKIVEGKLPRASEIYPYVSEKVQKVIDHAVEKEPAKRPKDCAEFKYELTKAIKPEEAVKPKSNAVFKWISVAAAIVIVAAAFWYWDYNRLKVRYYKDYAEKWGVPQGIYKLSKNEVSHREASYKFEYQKRKLIRMSLVNSVGKIKEHHDSEHMERPSDMKLFYQADGNLDYAEFLDRNGKILFRKDYSQDLKVMTFKRPDEFGTELSLSARTLKIHQSPTGDNGSAKGQVSRFLLTYDENGYVTKLEYAKYQNVKVGDADGIYARQYERDEKGREIKITYLGANGTIKNTKKGLAIKENEYLENDDWLRTSYFDRNGNPSKDETGVPVVILHFDEYGNRIKEEYMDENGKLVYRTDTKSAGFKYKYDQHGFNTERIYIDTDGNECVGNSGIAGTIMSYDEFGNVIKYFTVDIDRNPVYDMENGYFGYRSEFDENGNVTALWFLDKDGNVSTCKSGNAGISWTYDSMGNNTEVVYYDENAAPFLTQSGSAGYRYVYNDMNLVVEVQCLNTALQISPSENDGISIWKNAYDKRGNRIAGAYYDNSGKTLVLSQTDNIAGWGCKYDDDGNQTEYWTFDEDSLLSNGNNTYAIFKSRFDEYGNEIERKFYDSNQKPTEISSGYAGWVAAFDERGNEISSKFINIDGSPAEGFLISKSKYDQNDNCIEYMLYDTDGKLAMSSNGYAGWKAEYDNKNNQTKISYFGADGKLVNANDGFAYALYTYDEKGNLITGKYFGTDSKPINSTEYEAPFVAKKYDHMGNNIYQGLFKDDGLTPVENSKGVHYMTAEYDQFGNIVCLSGFDKNNKATAYVNGCVKKRMKYDRQGNETEVSYFDEADQLVNCDLGYAVLKKDYNKQGQIICYTYFDPLNKPALNKDQNSHKVEVDFDDKGNQTEARYYGTDNKLLRGEYAIIRYKYNDAGDLIEKSTYGDNNQPYRSDSEIDYYKIVYERNASGELMYSKYYKLNGELLATLDSDGNRVYSKEEICNYVYGIEIPTSIVEGLDFITANCDYSKVSFVWKLTEWSKYDLSDSKKSELKDYIRDYAIDQENVSLLKSVNWRITITVVDKADRELFKLYY